jgi:hypothetical protein
MEDLEELLQNVKALLEAKYKGLSTPSRIKAEYNRLPSNGRLGCFNRQTSCKKHSHWWTALFHLQWDRYARSGWRWREAAERERRHASGSQAVEIREGSRCAAGVPVRLLVGGTACRCSWMSVGKRWRGPPRKPSQTWPTGLDGR